MEQIKDCIIYPYSSNVDKSNYYDDINCLPDNITHIQIYCTDYIEPIHNLPSTLKYFSRDYDTTGHCFEGFGELNQIDNFPHGLEVLILHIDKYNSFLHLPPTLEFIVILNGFQNYQDIELSRNCNNKPKMIIPFNTKIFITTNYITNLYDIHIENCNTKLIKIDNDIYEDYFEFISENIPEKYKDYYIRNKY